MEYHFLGKYDKEKARQALLNLGYNEMTEPAHYFVLGKNAFIVHLTSAEEGSMQIQGEALEGIRMNGKCSKYYSELEKLAMALKPERIVDGSVKDVLPDMMKKISS